MFCYQCQETAKNTGCTVRGVCGKQEDTANLQDLLLFCLKGLAVCVRQSGSKADLNRLGRFAVKAMFSTITNVNFDNDR
ncbi:MAG TPA: hydroxylamine reductase, partial [Deltaproteobacteria bacterium]|nr:hydroxylamine reductase [Deltaproteobacteria bacterium]